MRIDELNALIAAVCPIISINSDGIIEYDPSATAAQKIAAQGVMATNLPLLGQVTQSDIFAQAETKVQELLENQAKAWGYTSIDSIGKYQNITDAQIALLSISEQPIVAKYRAECQALALYAASVWATCYSAMAAITAGTIPMPASIDAFIGTLPAAPVRP